MPFDPKACLSLFPGLSKPFIHEDAEKNLIFEMMRALVNKRSTLLLLASFLFLFTACREEEKGVKGCTDPEASNYDPTAIEADSASCEYPDEPGDQIIWNEGDKGEWNGEEFLGVINVSDCKGSLDTMTLNPNDTVDPGPFSMLVERDSNDQFGLVATLTNKRDLSAYEGGELRFRMLDPDSLRSGFTFRVFVHGKICNKNHIPCESVCSSRYVNVATDALNDSTVKRVSVPIPEFDDHSLEDVDHVMGIRGELSSGSDTVFAISEIRLTP